MTGDSIVYYRKRQTAQLLQICAVGFVGLGLWLILRDLEGTAGAVARAAGVISLLCFGLSGVLIGRKVTVRDAIFAVNHDGMTLMTGEADLFIDWKDVQGVGVAHMGDEKVLTLAFRRPEAILARMDAEQRRRAEANQAAGVPVVMIPQSLLAESVDTIRNTATRFFFAAG